MLSDGRNIHFTHVAKYLTEFCFSFSRIGPMRIERRLRCHELGDAGLTNNVSAWFCHYDNNNKKLSDKYQFCNKVVKRNRYLRIALSPLVNPFLQLGHIRVDPPPESAFSSVKCTSIRVLSEYSCRDSLVDPGHIGASFRLVLVSFSMAGVSEGIQNEGKKDFASACR